MLKKTRQVADLLGVHQFNLLSLISARKTSPPAKDASGHYSWSAADIQRARLAMRVDRRCKEYRSPEPKGGKPCDQ